MANLLNSGGKYVAELANARCDLLDSFWSVIDCIHGSHVRQKSLRGTNVTRSLFTTNMLFTRLKRQAVCHLIICIFRNTDQSTWHTALVLIFDGEESSVRATESKRNSKALRITENDICSEFARRFQQG